MINRRTALVATIAAGTGGAVLAGFTPALRAQNSLPDLEEVHFDPDAPVMGNPDGDVTVVEFRLPVPLLQDEPPGAARPRRA